MKFKQAMIVLGCTLMVSGIACMKPTETSDTEANGVTSGVTAMTVAKVNGGGSLETNNHLGGISDISYTQLRSCNSNRDIANSDVVVTGATETVETSELAEESAFEREMRLCAEAPLNVPNHEAGCHSDCFSYMSYTAVTNSQSPQWKLLRGEDTHTSSNGIRMVGDRYCIAVGLYYADSVGDKLDVVLENGTILQCIVGDFKSPKHTDPSRRYHTGGAGIQGDGSVVEMIVDGSAFYGVSSYPPEISGKVLKIVKVD